MKKYKIDQVINNVFREQLSITSVEARVQQRHLEWPDYVYRRVFVRRVYEAREMKEMKKGWRKQRQSQK